MSSSKNSNAGEPGSHGAGTPSQPTGSPAPFVSLSGEEVPNKAKSETVSTPSSEQTTTSEGSVDLSTNDGQENKKTRSQVGGDDNTFEGGVKRTADELEAQHEQTPYKKIKKKVDIRTPDVSLIPEMYLHRNDSDPEAFVEPPET
jgi:hypothetical protein